MLKSLIQGITGLLYPPVCGACGETIPAANRHGVCEPCESEIKTLEPPFCQTCGRALINGLARCGECRDEKFHFDRAFACAEYTGRLRALIHEYKFGQRKELRRFFNARLKTFAGKHLPLSSYEVVVPMPLARVSRFERGFNQSELLSRELSRTLGIPHASNEISRKKRPPQWQLSKSERKTNVQGAFLVERPETFRDKKVLLVDDILTTGHTASECARMLKEAGAAEVTVLALARGRKS